jgi:hypothetical protein
VQVDVAAQYDSPLLKVMEDDRLYLLSVVVTEAAVSFYQNEHLVSTVPIAFRVTQCPTQHTIVVGDDSITIGEMRFYPTALNLIKIREV